MLAVALMAKLVELPSSKVPCEPTGVENVIVVPPPLASTAGKFTYLLAKFVGLPVSFTLKVTEVAAPGLLGVPETVEPFKNNPSGKVPDDTE